MELTLLQSLLICLSLVSGTHCCFGLISISAVDRLLLVSYFLRYSLINVEVAVVAVVSQRVWLQQPFLLESAWLILRESPRHLVPTLLLEACLVVAIAQ